MEVLSVNNLTKKYNDFKLNNVSFSLNSGEITGFVGRNGAGKSTTFKAIMNFIKLDSGNIKFFSKYDKENLNKIKNKIGFVNGGFEYYSLKKIKTITNITSKFYKNFDFYKYKEYLQLFEIDENKKIKDLSQGMKVKYSICLALSHNAKLLLMDEPTSGLDPISRDEILDIFLNLINKENISIFFSTHIISDLQKCADKIIYIKKGKIIFNKNIDNLQNEYKCVRIQKNNFNKNIDKDIIGLKETKNGYEGLIKNKSLQDSRYEYIDTNIENIITYLERG